MDPFFDRFSLLPEEVLTLIIYFLPLVDAFRFCLVKKEWHTKYQWVHSSAFELQETRFMSISTRQMVTSLGKRIQSSDLEKCNKLKFIDLLDRTMSNLVSPIVLSRFGFCWYYYSFQYLQNIDMWISFALSRNVEELILDFSDGDLIDTESNEQKHYVLPDVFYENGSNIRDLNLNSCNVGVCNFGGFSNLKTLTLTTVEILVGQLVHVVNSCPLLEDLSLVECYGLIMLQIFSPMLNIKRLVVRHCEPLSLGLKLCLPKLEYFEYEGGLARFFIRQMIKLEEVVLNFCMHTPFPYRFEDIRQLVWYFADARVVKICTNAPKVFPDEYLYVEPLVELLYVENLTMKISMERYEIPGVLLLLKSSPYLRTLSLSILARPMATLSEFQYCEIYNGYPELPDKLWQWDADEWTLPYLQYVEAYGFTGKDYEMKLLKLIMMSAEALTLVEITPRFPENGANYAEAQPELKNAKTASDSVEIQWLHSERFP